jgi:hypothetical protein
MRSMTSSEIHQGIRKALAQVSLRLAMGKLDHSGRYYPEPELRISGLNSRLRSKSTTRSRTASSRRNPKTA